MFWIITTIICFTYYYWFLTVPRIYEANVGHNKYESYGLPIWALLGIIVIALIPIANIIVLIVGIVALFVIKDCNDATFDEAFGHSKVMITLNSFALGIRKFFALEIKKSTRN